MTKKRISITDVARAARKLQEEKDGKRKISDFSTPALRQASLGFESQYKDDKSRAGSAEKKKQGIWSAVKQIRHDDPHIDADSLWHSLNGARIEPRWELDVDGDRIYQTDLESGKIEDIGYSTFVRHYFTKAKPK